MAGGRPRIWDNPDELQKACDKYFLKRKKPTVTGLALFLGFADKTTLYEYRDRPEFSYPIKVSLTRIELYHEEGLSENNVAGRIFALKNMGWKDRSEWAPVDPDGNALALPQIMVNIVKPNLEDKQ